jgi:hypothetical protein
MKRQRQSVLICATALLLWCGAARETAAYMENFESYTNGMGVRDIPGWNAPSVGGAGNGNYTVWQNSEINSYSNINYGAVGYNNSQGVEVKFAGSGSANSQAGALRTLTGGDILDNSQPGFFSMQVRLSSWAIGGTGNTNLLAGGSGTTYGGNSAMLYLGSGMQWNTSQNKFYWTNATAFAVYFFAGDNGVNSSIFVDGKAAENSSWQPGFGATAGTQTSWAYRNASNTTAWARDTWYTVQMQNITLNASGGQATNATAALTIFESDNPNVKLLDNYLITAQGGSSNAWGTAFTQINQIGFADVRIGAVDTFDNIVLIPEPSTAVLCVSGLLGLATVVRRRQRGKG